MKKILPIFILLCSALFTLSSCLKGENDNITYYDDTAITAFSIDYVNRPVHTVGQNGEDSVYVKTDTVIGNKFYIDQINREIYNPDSLPMGIDVKHILCNVSGKNGGSIVVNVRTKDRTQDSLVFFSNTDSLDFTEPLEFRTYNNSGTAYRSYRVKVNVHTQDGNTFGWVNVGVNNDLGALTAMKAVAMGGKIYVFGNNEAGTVVYSTTGTDGKTWAKGTQTFGTEAYNSACAYNNMLYIADSGTIYSSADGSVWTEVSAAGVKQLLGASKTKLYALVNDGTLASSADGGITWISEAMDSDATLLPTANINFCSNALPTNPNTNRLWIVGNRNVAAYPYDVTAMVWNKIEENAPGSENQAWAYYNISSDNNYPAPRLTNLQVIAYADGMIAIGGKGTGADATEGFAGFYKSNDGGITWHKDKIITLPDGFSSSETSFAMIADADNYIWIMCGTSGQVWKGRLAALGWSDNPTDFTK